MLGGSSTAAATITSSTTSTTPASPTRPGRLRGLSYLRNYTHLNHSPRNPSAPLSRSHTSPASPHTTEPGLVLQEQGEGGSVSPSPQRSKSTKGNLSGWVPTVGGQSGASRVATTSQATNADTTQDIAPMTRNRAGTHSDSQPGRMSEKSQHPGAARSMSANDVNGVSVLAPGKKQMPTIRLIPHHEARTTRPSLTFPIITRTLPTEEAVVRVGRYSERDNQAAHSENGSMTVPVGFKSKVVSRRHCEFWSENGQWYVKDVKSSSGTFLNHVRLSAAGVESRPYPVKDGDIVQLGIDFKGGEEVIFRCVKIRVECNRSWQKGPNQFNTSTHKRLRNLASSGTKDADSASVNSSECSICLNPVGPCQALFVAPCAHVWHYKCIRNLIYPAWPSFQCPNCRDYADLDADIDAAEPDSDAEYAEAIRASEQDGDLPHSTTMHTLAAGPSSDDEEISQGLQQTSLDTAPGASEPGHDLACTPGENNPLMPVRSATPTNSAPFALVSNIVHGNGASNHIPSGPEGPTTPRNDAGPFLLDSAVSNGQGTVPSSTTSTAVPNGGSFSGPSGLAARRSLGRKPIPEAGEEEVNGDAARS